MDNISNIETAINWNEEIDTLGEEPIEEEIVLPKIDMKRLNTEIFFKLSQVLDRMKTKYEYEPTKSTYDNIILLEGIKN